MKRLILLALLSVHLLAMKEDKFLHQTFFKGVKEGTFVALGEGETALFFEKGWKEIRFDDLLAQPNLKTVDYLFIEKKPLESLQKIDFSNTTIDVISVPVKDLRVKKLLLSKGYTFIKKVASHDIYKKPSYKLIEWGERPPLRFIQQYLPEKPVVVEAGAHVGNDTVLMNKRWKGATIYAFEPSPEVYQKLRKKCFKHKNIKTYALALGDRKGMVEFYESTAAEHSPWGTDAQGSLLPPSEKTWPWKHIGFKKPIKVPVTTLDDWAQSQGVKNIDFLWLDMQGSEFQMLKASPKILKTIKVIQTEVSRRPFYEGTTLLDEGRAWLESQGFTAIYITPEEHGDALFVRKL
jgi:FkbM family methyltransferase